MKNVFAFIILTIFSANLFAQDELVKEWRTISEFKSINMTGNFELYIIQDNKYELTIEAQTSVMSSIVTTISGKTLYIKPENYMKIKSAFPVKIYVRLPELHKIFLSGSGIIKAIGLQCKNLEIEMYGTGNIDIDELITEFLNTSAYGAGKIELDVEANSINATITGTGNIELKGKCPQTQLYINGTGSINTKELNSDECKAQIIGTGNIYTSCIKYLSASIYGTGNVYYSSDPEVSLNSFGTGRIIKQSKSTL